MRLIISRVKSMIAPEYPPISQKPKHGIPEERLAMWRQMEERRETEEAKLLDSMIAQLPELKSLFAECGGWNYEDPIYRFYHQSMKVFYVQELTIRIVSKLQELAPHLRMNDWFLE